MRCSDATSSPARRRACGLFGVVGQKAHAADAELAQHLDREVEPAPVQIEAQRLVGFVGVVALRLEPIGADLVGDAVPAPFLIEVEQDAAPVLGHPAHCPAQLVAAIALEAPEQVAREAGGVEPHGDGLRQIGAADQDRHLIAQALPAAEHHELGPRRAFERHRRAADDLEVRTWAWR